MEVKLYLTRAAAAGLRGEAPATPEVAELNAALGELGLTLRPAHPGVEEPLLATEYTGRVDGMEAGARVVERLRRCAAVDSVYLKPDAMPA